MFSLFRLIRLPNLIVVAITQWLIAIVVLAQTSAEYGVGRALNNDQLILLILATLCISAAAYCINDVLDYHIDLVNHPEKVIVNKEISARVVYWLIAVFVIFGFICSLILAFQKDELELLWLYPLFTMLLGGYSRIFKMHPFVGNLLIAGSCSGVAALIWLAEREAWAALPIPVKNDVTHLLLVFLAYAFLATWIREIVKDLEDYQGDLIGGRRTLPIAFGEKKAKIFIHALAGLLAVILLSNIFYTEGLLAANTKIIAVTVILILISLAMQYLLFLSKTKDDFHRLSSYWKYFMLGGLILLSLY